MDNIELLDREALMAFAGRFRAAIDGINRTDLPIAFMYFPRGSCGDTSLLLGAALKDKGLGSFRYICGSSGGGNQFESHAWLQASDIIIDITADQFEDGLPSVFVGEDTGWYKRWNNICDLGEGDYRLCTGGIPGELGRAYGMIMASIKSE